ncbi:hypothetical protein KUTeg_007937, partial [Tegillarca granosa]
MLLFVFVYIFAPQQGYVYNNCRVKQVFVSLTTDFRMYLFNNHNTAISTKKFYDYLRSISVFQLCRCLAQKLVLSSLHKRKLRFQAMKKCYTYKG